MSNILSPPRPDVPLPGTIAEPLEAKRLAIPEIIVFRADFRRDERRSVMPSFNALQLAELGIAFSLYQENHCISPTRGIVRGFHYQLPPHSQSKLIRVTRGLILDVNVDMREGAPTYGRHVATELSPNGWNQVYVPEGFAHCYCTLEDDSEVIFKLGHPFAPAHARGFTWNDPALGIEWPIAPDEAIVLDRDLNRPSFKTLDTLFPYEPFRPES